MIIDDGDLDHPRNIGNDEISINNIIVVAVPVTPSPRGRCTPPPIETLSKTG